MSPLQEPGGTRGPRQNCPRVRHDLLEYGPVEDWLARSSAKPVKESAEKPLEHGKPEPRDHYPDMACEMSPASDLLQGGRTDPMEFRETRRTSLGEHRR